ncbi:HhH-GPD family protein [Desulfovibrio sp. X2]|uniref:endonuclease III domain-containing protein n=1 Tax=Desulfovibrio sp. X2 TaxID=941449 RepID=UPI000358852E|nr:base excision DNA repair protein [Desulfovibrio sp. X2]EPR42401.1 HhH-GPD family protein [Desulfovibrio sp. X2]
MKTNPIRLFYETLREAFGPCDWWPADSAFEIAVGGILTQNTSWMNVQKAIATLKEAEALTPRAMRTLAPEELAEHIRSAGYFRVKAARLGNFLEFLAAEAPSEEALDDSALPYLTAQELAPLREKILAVRGIGPETADSMLLYALRKPTFVVDAYTARFMQRHGLVPEDVGYYELQEAFTDALPTDVALFNEYHSLIVRLGQVYCKKSKPLCGECPLGRFLEGAA